MIAWILTSLVCCESKVTRAYCSVDAANQLVITDEPHENYIVSAEFEDSMDANGWYQMHVDGKEGAPDRDMMRCAGAVEGYLSHYRIYHHFRMIKLMNGWEIAGDYSSGAKTFLENNLRYVRQSVTAYEDSQYWQGIGLILAQFDGLCEGYNMSKVVEEEEKPMDVFDMWVLQSEGDLNDILYLPEVVETGPVGPTQRRNFVTPGEHCSGLIRLLPDYSDVYFAHDAWSDYRELHGQLKEYNLPTSLFKAKKITMSTRIGKLSSYDDFYINDAGLFVLETTMNNFNEDLYSATTPQTLFTWMRAVYSTWTSDNGKEWTETFIKHNSGTYNNQYLVIDSKKFVKGEKPTTDLLWVIEQFPGIYRSQDITDVLVNKGFFPSINTPWFPDLFEIAGYPQQVASWGDMGSYWAYEGARFFISEREAPRIKTFDDFKAFMRYNNWKRDLYSNGDPGQQIMARYDLRREGFHPLLPPRLFGGLDSKCLSLNEAKWRLQFHAYASPTFDIKNGIPPFEFPDGYDHKGLPKKWDNFTWIKFKSAHPDICQQQTTKDACDQVSGCGWCMYSQTCSPGDSTGPLFEEDECMNGWQVHQEMPTWALPVICTVTILIVLLIGAVLVMHYRMAGQQRN